MTSLVGKLALITGAASGIGLACARIFSREGADLVLVDISEKVFDVASELSDQYTGLNITGHICDVTNSGNVNRLMEEIKEKHKNYAAPNVLVNSAGIAKSSRFIDLTEENFDRTIAINIKGTFLITQAVCKLLVANYPNVKFNSPQETYASIINLASQAGKLGAPGLSDYAITKAGVDALAKSLAKELGPYRIRCNSILPSFIETPMVSSIFTNRDQAKESLIEKAALKRFGEPDEVANLILFIASDSSSYVNGSSIDIHGGTY